MLKVITPTEYDGLDQRTLVMVFEVPDNQFDLLAAVKEAAKEFCLTEEGKHIYANCNCCSFNWADFELYVPNPICEKHGFKKIELNAEPIDEFTNLNEQLVEEEDIFPEE